MSIFHVLVQQYRDIHDLFCDTREAIELKNRGAALILHDLAAKKLKACMCAEHAVVYPRIADVAELVEDVTNIRRVDATIESSLNVLRIGELAGEAWDAEIERLISLLDQSVDLKELSLFPMAGLAITTPQLVQIGVDFVAYLEHATRVSEVSITYDPIDPIKPGIDEIVDLEFDDWTDTYQRRQAV